jgi:hypothetical protein
MKKIALASALICSSILYAQGHSYHGGFGFGGFHSGKVVTGAPYSATVTNQVTQTLADGNTIQRTTSAQVARDSQGRTYEQQTVQGGPLAQNGPVTLTFISDPTTGYSYVLNPTTKVATRRVLKASSSSASTGDHLRSQSGATAQNTANRVESDLGVQTVNGVSAQGKIVTRTVPALAVGNAQPIVSTSETWYSPDLQIPVLAKRSDPRVGQSTYSLTNISRAEPPASLFQIPSNYTVQDAPANGGRISGAHGVR